MRASRSDVVSHGLLVGFIGYLTVFAGVGLGDVLQGRSFFHTFSLLGGWLFHGLDDPTQVRVWPGAVFAYNGLHLVAFLGFGVVASWMMAVAERGPLLWYGALVMYLFVFLHLFASVVLMTEPMRGAFSLWHLTIPSLLALATMSWALLQQHPQIRHELDVWVDDTDIELPPGESLDPAESALEERREEVVEV
jgi:hypothetical protein